MYYGIINLKLHNVCGYSTVKNFLRSIRNLDTIQIVQFEWDERKNKTNREKHGVWFEEAQTVFEDNNARVFFDKTHSSHEERYLIIGLSFSSRIIMVVHCFRQNDQIIRIISARKATKKERSVYEKGI